LRASSATVKEDPRKIVAFAAMVTALLAASSAIRTLEEGKSMIRRIKNTAAVILAVGGMAFAAVALAVASTGPAGAASVSSARVAGPDFTCPAKAVCTFYGEDFNNTPHVWWPGNRYGKWYNFHNLGVNNPGSLRNNSSSAVYIDSTPGGRSHWRCAPGNTPGSAYKDLDHSYGWFFITVPGVAACATPPSKVRA
jgi:hypothetical protein